MAQSLFPGKNYMSDKIFLDTAQESGCSLLYSEDLNPGQKIKDLQIINPFIEEK